MILGAQLYTVREQCQDEQGLKETLADIAKIGYTAVQVSGIGPIEPQRVRELCDENGLDIPVTHTPPDRILQETQRVIEEHRILGASHVGIGMMPAAYAKTPEGVARFLQDFRPAAEKIAAAGMQLHYHNHDFELTRFGDKTLLDHLIEGLSDRLLGFILDTYWLQAGGADPATVVQRLAGRIPVIHLKDMAMRDGKAIMTPVLSGNMNFDSVLKACQEGGCQWLMIEQDTCDGPPVDALHESYRNLKALGYR